jgi:hypothetical protein
MFYIVVSYTPQYGKSAKVLIHGIYNTNDHALTRQKDICGGECESTNLGNNSVYGINGNISWIKTVDEGDLNQVDIYAPDTI